MTQIGIETNTGHDPACDMWSEASEFVEKLTGAAIDFAKQLGRLVLDQD